jgi:hypothetical protein
VGPHRAHAPRAAGGGAGGVGGAGVASGFEGEKNPSIFLTVKINL